MAKRKPVQPSGAYKTRNIDGSYNFGPIYLGRSLYLREGDWLEQIAYYKAFMVETRTGLPVLMTQDDPGVMTFRFGELMGEQQLRFRRLRRG